MTPRRFLGALIAAAVLTPLAPVPAANALAGDGELGSRFAGRPLVGGGL